MTDQDIRNAAIPRILDEPIVIRMGPLLHTLPARTPLFLADIAVLRVLEQNLGRRPLAWSVTAGSQFYGLDSYLLQQGLARSVQTAIPDTTLPGITPASLTGFTFDMITTERLAWDTYRYAGLLDAKTQALDDTNLSFSSSLSLPFSQLAYAYEGEGDFERTVANLERAAMLSPNPAIEAALNQYILQYRPEGNSPAPTLP